MVTLTKSKHTEMHESHKITFINTQMMHFRTAYI